MIAPANDCQLMRTLRIGTQCDMEASSNHYVLLFYISFVFAKKKNLNFYIVKKNRFMILTKEKERKKRKALKSTNIL